MDVPAFSPFINISPSISRFPKFLPALNVLHFFKQATPTDSFCLL